MGRQRRSKPRRKHFSLDDIEPHPFRDKLALLPLSWQEQRDDAVELRVAENRPRLKPLTDNQGVYFKTVEEATVTICTGPAGTGKTYMACGMAAQQLQDGLVERIVISRPLVACGPPMGFLPGDVNAKVSPHMQPLLEAFEDFFEAKELKKLLFEKKIEMRPLELMRGASIRHAFIICDEAQNAEYVQLHMLLTRFAEGSKVVVTGDSRQTDLSSRNDNPLLLIAQRLVGHPQIVRVKLTKDDVCRHPLTSWIDERLSDFGPDLDAQPA